MHGSFHILFTFLPLYTFLVFPCPNPYFLKFIPPFFSKPQSLEVIYTGENCLNKKCYLNQALLDENFVKAESRSEMQK